MQEAMPKLHKIFGSIAFTQSAALGLRGDNEISK